MTEQKTYIRKSDEQILQTKIEKNPELIEEGMQFLFSKPKILRDESDLILKDINGNICFVELKIDYQGLKKAPTQIMMFINNISYLFGLFGLNLPLDKIRIIIAHNAPNWMKIDHSLINNINFYGKKIEVIKIKSKITKT